MVAFRTSSNRFYDTTLPKSSSVAPSEAWGARLLIPEYTGPLFRLHRIADGAKLDIYPNLDRSPNVSGVLTFLNGALFCKVDLVYAQTGSGNDLNQTTVSAMPFFWLTQPIRGKYGFTTDINLGSQFFNIPSTVTGNGQSVSILSCYSLMSTSFAGLMTLGATVSTPGSITISPGGQTSRVLQLQLSNTFMSANFTKMRSQPESVVLSSGPSSLILYQDDTFGRLEYNTFNTNTAGTYSGGRWGSSAGGTFLSSGELYALVVYPEAITRSDIVAAQKSINQSFDVLTQADTQLVMTGNSIVAGAKATLNLNNLRQAEPLFSKRIFTSNRAVSGTTAYSVTNPTAGAVIAPAVISGLTNIITGPEPTNDIDFKTTGNITGSMNTLWTNSILPWIQACQALGWSVIMPTTLPRGWSGSTTDRTQKENERITYNNLITSNAAAYGYRVTDYANISLMSNSANLTYYADGLHPTSAGYALMAQLLANVVNTIIGQTNLSSLNFSIASNSGLVGVF